MHYPTIRNRFGLYGHSSRCQPLCSISSTHNRADISRILTPSISHTCFSQLRSLQPAVMHALTCFCLHTPAPFALLPAHTQHHHGSHDLLVSILGTLFLAREMKYLSVEEKGVEEEGAAVMAQLMNIVTTMREALLGSSESDA